MKKENLVLTDHAIKRHCKRLQLQLNALGHNFSLCQAQQFFAKTLGFNSWQQLSLALKQEECLLNISSRQQASASKIEPKHWSYLMAKQGLILISGKNQEEFLQFVLEQRSQQAGEKIALATQLHGTCLNSPVIAMQEQDSIPAMLRRAPTCIAMGRLQEKSSFDTIIEMVYSGHAVYAIVEQTSMEDVINKIVSRYEKSRQANILNDFRLCTKALLVIGGTKLKPAIQDIFSFEDNVKKNLSSLSI